MPNTYSWSIYALDTYPSQDSLTDVVHNIHWGMTATSDQTDADGIAYVVNCIGTQTIAAPDSGDYTAFSDLTQEIVEAWLEASDIDLDAIKAGLDAQLVEKITPTSVTKQLPTA